MILPDVMISLKYIEEQRKALGKHDEDALKKKQIEENIGLAMKSGRFIGRKNNNEDVKEFLREIQKH